MRQVCQARPPSTYQGLVTHDYILPVNIQLCILTEMKYDELIDKVGRLSLFDLATLVQVTDEPRATLRIQLHRWCKSSKLIALRRGMYALPPRHASPNPAAVANTIYTPSYITSHWAMSFLGLIPEKATVYTSVTTRKSALFNNPLGTFRYRHIKPTAFFGYHAIELSGAKILMAEPEKALLDFWHAERGHWTYDRMAEMRFQNTGQIDDTRLRRYAERFRSPRLMQAFTVWLQVRDQETEGAREL